MAFHDIRQGDESDVELDAVMQGWINGGFMEVIGSAASATGSGSPVEDDSGRLTKRARRVRAPRPEPGEGSG
ncbi:MAG: hypothetical protein ACRDQ0_21925, partial [Pseudonocardia sp.]